MENKRLKIGILGLGLIGGSILKALYKLNKYDLFTCSKSSHKEASIFSASSDNINILKDCEVVFVCSKMNDTKDDLKKLENIVSNNAIVADVCSIKGFLKDSYKFNYIPSHPMAGTEFSGFKSSFEELFIDTKWIMGCNNKILSTLIKEMGAKPIILNATEHDILAAEISHLPMLISTALFAYSSDEAKKIASSGFRDTTRLSMTNPDLAYDMLNLNRKNILIAYEKFKNEFEKIINMDEIEFKNFIQNVAKKRFDMYDENGKNKL